MTLACTGPRARPGGAKVKRRTKSYKKGMCAQHKHRRMHALYLFVLASVLSPAQLQPPKLSTVTAKPRAKLKRLLTVAAIKTCQTVTMREQMDTKEVF